MNIFCLKASSFLDYEYDWRLMFSLFQFSKKENYIYGSWTIAYEYY